MAELLLSLQSQFNAAGRDLGWTRIPVGRFVYALQVFYSLFLYYFTCPRQVALIAMRVQINIIKKLGLDLFIGKRNWIKPLSITGITAPLP